MTTNEEIESLSAALGGSVEFVVTGGVVVAVHVYDVNGIGHNQMPLVQAAERLRGRISDKVGAAILGFRGAIRCCRVAGLDEDRVYQLVKEQGCD